MAAGGRPPCGRKAFSLQVTVVLEPRGWAGAPWVRKRSFLSRAAQDRAERGPRGPW